MDSRPERPTLLVVEDDARIRTIVVRVLEAEGYHVLSAEHGQAALRLVASLELPLDLLITDLSLPGLGGEALVGELARHQKVPPVLFLSGKSPKDVPHLADVLLTKPFRISELSIRVRNLLGRATSSHEETG